ncbi:glycosyltransferase family 61 protein [Aurantibacillus circumpalustris]|uniref:glycosyltransferase family 61 protein n=1 Tax=Aurantibacillus circumpalustris TaxID=3036359 RepID=UPI00295AEB1D|nr:glycosyltransferase family 61 protein [Aurantibacillus circumpalustris]
MIKRQREAIYNKHVSLRQTPKNLKKEDFELFAHELSKEINATTVTQLSHVFVLKDTIFSLRKFQFYLSYSHIHKLSKKSVLKRFLLLFSVGQKINKAVWIIDNWSNGYFHWFTDALPRLIASEKIKHTSTVILPKEFEQNSYINDSLKLLNYKVHFYDQKIVVKELVLPSHTAPTGNYNKNIITSIRDRFYKNNKTIPHRNIFISRQKASKRKIINEIEVVELLKLYDYEIHFFEDYTLNEQIEIMSQTKSLIGVHGAGLTNMLFMSENGQVLELRNKNDALNNCYFSLASDLNHSYYYQLNDGNSKDTHIVDLTVNLGELKVNLEMMKNEASKVDLRNSGAPTS